MKGLDKMLREDHVKILGLLEGLSDSNMPMDELMIRFSEMGHLLVCHIEIEDKKLYPFLREAAREDIFLSRLLDLFEADMKEVSGAIQAFYKKRGSGLASDETRAELNTLILRIRERITREENFLLGEYQRLSG